MTKPCPRGLLSQHLWNGPDGRPASGRVESQAEGILEGSVWFCEEKSENKSRLAFLKSLCDEQLAECASGVLVAKGDLDPSRCPHQLKFSCNILTKVSSQDRPVRCPVAMPTYKAGKGATLPIHVQSAAHTYQATSVVGLSLGG